MGPVMHWWIVENTLLAAFLALLVVLVSRIRRVPPVVRHGLWLVVLIKLIVPPVFSLGISVPATWDLVARYASEPRQREMHVQHVFEVAGRESSLDPPANLRSPLAGELAIERLPVNEMMSADPLVPLEDSQSAVPIESDETETAQVEPAERPLRRSSTSDIGSRPPGLSISPSALLFWGALTGTLVAVFIQSARLVRMWRLLSRTVDSPVELTNLVAEIAARLGIRPPVAAVSNETRSPFVCALSRPVLVWPASGLASLHDSACRAIIVHELAHLARRDHWIGWIELAASCGWWWNPLFWYVRHQLHENAELACDAWVTGLFPAARRAYAGALIDLAELDAMKTAIVPALGVGDGSRKLFERRLVMIMGGKVRYRMDAWGFMGMCLLALVALPGCSAGFAAEEPVPTDPLPGHNVDGPAPVVTLPNPALQPFDPFKGPAAEPGSNPAADETPPAPKAPPKTLDIITGDVVELEPVEPPATRAQEPAAATNDERLKRLEDRLESLVTELRNLNLGIKNPDLKRDPNAQPGPKKASPSTASEYRKAVTAALSEAKRVTPHVETATKTPVTITYRKAVVEAITITRATYPLSPGKAEEFAAFFKANLSDDIEVKVKGDSLIVTARPDDQSPIAGFIHLLQTRGVGAGKADAKGQNDGDSKSPKVNWRTKKGPETRDDSELPKKSSRIVPPKRANDVADSKGIWGQ